MTDPTPAPTPPPESASAYEQERRGKREKLLALGVDPYGAAETNLQPLSVAKAMYTADMGHDGGPAVKVAGRIVLKRDMGKLSFLTLRDEGGDLQVALDKKRLDETAWQVNGLLDLGDQIVVEGPIGVTKKGEVTVWATALRVAAKSVLPPPGKWTGLEDVELRYRQRYVDLWANPDVMRQMRLRSAVVAEVRAYLTNLGYVEVETPMMQPLAGGAAARPFTTHHHALNIPLYLRIAPELYLKRLLVGGFTKVFELNRNFRNEGVSPRHNPEFTMLEAYEAFGSWETMADLVEGMVCHIAEKLFGGLKIVHRGDAETRREINLTRPWRRVSMVDLVAEELEWRFAKGPITDHELWAAICRHRVRIAKLLAKRFEWLGAIVAPLSQLSHGSDIETAIEHVATGLRLESTRLFTSGGDRQSDQPSVTSCTWLETSANAMRYHVQELLKQEVLFKAAVGKQEPAEQLVALYEKFIEPYLIDPTFVTHVPSVIIPLARKNKDDPFFADVYELAINGQEISPGYSELNDPDVQAANFAHQVGDEAERQKTDDDFLTALKYGMPPAGGLGLGIDRLVMMLTGAESIRDVILFPLMRPLG